MVSPVSSPTAYRGISSAVMVCDSSAKAGAQSDSTMVSARSMQSSFFMSSVPFLMGSGLAAFIVSIYQTVILSAGAVYMPSPSCTPKVSWNFSKFDRGTLQREYSTGCVSLSSVGSSAAA